MDDGEAPDGNDSEMGKRGSGVADEEEWETRLVRVCGSTAAVPPKTGARTEVEEGARLLD